MIRASTPILAATAVCTGAAATAAGFAWYSKRLRHPIEGVIANGNVHPQLEPVRKIFENILKNEEEGLALAIYRKGELVADLYGGYADRNSLQPWRSDTLAVTFSTTKIVGSLAIAMLVSKGHLRYEELVRKYWPSFAANGKENITVQMIMEHQAGLIKFADEFNIEKAGDPEFIAKLIEKTEPMWPPGTAVGYHAVTFGWLVDQLVRRSDPNGRGIGDYYREEILPYMSEKDFYIGLPMKLNDRVAKVVNAKRYESFKDFLLTCCYRLRDLSRKQNLRNIACEYPKWVAIDDENAINDPKLYAVENVAALGIGSARGLASIAAAVMKNNLIGTTVWAIIGKPTEMKPIKDIVINQQHLRGHGFFYFEHPTRSNSFLIGHGGHGGQIVVFDPQTQIVIAMIRNGMRKNQLAQHDAIRIINKTFQLLDQK